MLKDAQGLTVTTDSPVAIAAINRFTDQALSYGKDAETVLLQGNAADRECALIHAYTAAHYLSQEEAAFHRRATPHLNAAKRRLADISERERWTVQAIAAWAEGDIKRAILLHEIIVEKYPQDLLAIQQAQYHYFYRGETLQLLNIAERVLPANPDNHYLYGMVAFGLEQRYRLGEAEEMARRAVAINRNDPWAHHAIAHVLDAQGRTDEGIAWMEGHADTWAHCNSMLYTHNWWHIALYYLTKRAFQTVLALYDGHLWGRARKDSPKDQVGAIATLLRLELKGIDVGSRWLDLSHYLSPRLHEHCLPFQDLHYIYALTRTGQIEHVAEMLHSMHLHAQSVNPCWRKAWTEVAIPAAKAIVAYASGSWAEAIVYFKSVLPRLQDIGGSHTQRELFQQLYLDAVQKDQHYPAVYRLSA
jgi:tetratricopeptide (TPR) repeat protein